MKKDLLQKLKNNLPLILGVGALILNVLFIYNDLPYVLHPDEPSVVLRAAAMGTGDFNPHYFVYPSLWFYILFLFQGLGAVAGLILGLFKSLDHITTLVFTDPSYFFAVARLITAVTSAGAVYVATLLGQKISRWTGFVAGLTTALFAPFITTAHHAIVDAPLVFFMLISLLHTITFYEKQQKKNLWYAAIFAGLATSIKYNGVVIFIPIIFALLLRKGKLTSFFQAVGLSVSAFFLTSPFILLDSKTALLDFGVVLHGTAVLTTQAIKDTWFYLNLIVTNQGLALVIIAILGLYAGLQDKKTRGTYILISSVVLPYLLLIQWADYKAARFFLPLVPLLGIGTGYLLQRIKEKLPQKSSALIITTCLGLLCVPSIKQVIQTELIFKEPNTSQQIVLWIKANITKQDSIFEDHAAKTKLQPNAVTIEKRLKTWEKEGTSRSEQFRALYAKLLEIHPHIEGYNLVYTNQPNVRAFSAGLDPKNDYQVSMLDGVTYVITTPDAMNSYPNFYEYVEKNFTRVYSAKSTIQGEIIIFKK